MSDNRVRIWFSLFVLAVFCVGIAGGIAIDRGMARRTFVSRGLDRGGPMGFAGGGAMGGRRGGPPPPGMLVERLTRDLALTADQQAKIETVLNASRTRVEILQRDVRERFDAEQRGLRDEIRKVLTPEQQQKFDEREKERGRFGRRGPPK